jgi:uncharacterized protein (DUF427 family)
MKATWNGTVIAESDDTVLVEGNHYFPASALNRDYSLMVNGEMNTDAVWYYAEPKPEAEMVRDRVAFWKGVQVTA